MCILCDHVSDIDYVVNSKHRYLNISSCKIITCIPMLPNVKILFCNGCTSLTSISNSPNVEKLVCNYCTSLTELPEMPKLRELFCEGCTSLTKISNIPSLCILICEYCTALTEISGTSNLTDLICKGCTSLTEIPTGTYFCNAKNCRWLKRGNPDFEKNIQNLRICQAMWKRKLTVKRLEKVIPVMLEIYYSPGYKGEILAYREFQNIAFQNLK